jgi:small-conductance mechanosensitive channel
LLAVFDIQVFHNSVQRWLIASAAAIGAWIVLSLAVRVVRGRLSRMAAHTRTQWDDLVVHTLGRTRSLALLVVAMWLGASLLALPPRIETLVGRVAAVVILLQLGIWCSSGLAFWLERYTARELDSDRGAATTVSAIGFVARLVIWSVLLLVALDNAGVDVTALVAGLGVGGVAVALATQNILGDLFASLSIVLDKPFVLGDFIIVDSLMGTVEHVGLKTTRVRSLWGEQVVFSNSDLLDSRLRNFGRMQERRVVFTLGVTYQTPRDKLAKIPAIVREAIEEQPDTRFDRSHFSAYGDFALQFESVYYILSPDYNAYMDRNQAIYLRIHERFEQEGIEFAYPTQTLFMQRTPAPAATAD